MNDDRHLAIGELAKFLDLPAAVAGVLIFGPTGPRIDISRADLVPAAQQSAQAGGFI